MMVGALTRGRKQMDQLSESGDPQGCTAKLSVGPHAGGPTAWSRLPSWPVPPQCSAVGSSPVPDGVAWVLSGSAPTALGLLSAGGESRRVATQKRSGITDHYVNTGMEIVAVAAPGRVGTGE